eukprot:CAMPEP_0117684826 /NCGR_PEP_ID=MMETSP0804-20121206/21352_1 /TAXON_ID=1074897 /ORGANISM="Tetraselmis astigmatica, Strain CCMP880" /LENGTH=418 /DNA_ID=CAMNT_0005495935 /DNA_START=64 /DNA_END=1321 /DNA_ORIENTATION=-
MLTLSIIVSAQQVLQIAKPVLGEASRLGVQNLAGSLSAGSIGFALVILLGAGDYWILVVVTIAVFVAYYFAIRLGLDRTEFPDQFSSTLLLVTLEALRAGTTTAGTILAIGTTIGISYGVIVTIVLSVAVFPRPASAQVLAITKDALEELLKSNYIALAGPPDTNPEGTTEQAPDPELLWELQRSTNTRLRQKLSEVEQNIESSKNEGYLGYHGERFTNGLYFPTWPARCIDSGLPVRHLFSLCEGIVTCSSLVLELQQILMNHLQLQVDTTTTSVLRQLYEDPDGGQMYLKQAKDKLILVMHDCFVSFPRGIRPVRKLCPRENLDDFYKVMERMSEREDEEWHRAQAAARMAGKGSVDGAGKPAQVPIMFPPGLEGLHRAMQLASFRFVMETLAAVLEENLALINSIIQELLVAGPW